MSLSAREEDKDRVVASMETIVQAFLGDALETLRQSVSDLGVETERRIDALREESKSNLETLRTELLSADESVKSEAFTAVETRANSMAEHAESRLDNARRDLDRRLDEMEGRLQEEHLSISERLDGAERGLMNHDEASSRITELLDTLGHVLVRDNAPQETAAIAPEPTPVSVADPSTDHDGVPTEVEVTLAGPTQQSTIDTQPIPVGGSNSIETEEMEGALDRVDLTVSVPTE